MPAYFLIDLLEVTDPAKMEDYKKQVGPVVEKFGGRYLIAGSPAEVVEGAWRLTFPVLIQFPSREQARRWYDSEEYRPLKALRLAASRANAVFLDGR
jgi:uncharacterized protein (DUF1330 family)